MYCSLTLAIGWSTPGRRRRRGLSARSRRGLFYDEDEILGDEPSKIFTPGPQKCIWFFFLVIIILKKILFCLVPELKRAPQQTRWSHLRLPGLRGWVHHMFHTWFNRVSEYHKPSVQIASYFPSLRLRSAPLLQPRRSLLCTPHAALSRKLLYAV